MLSNKELMIWWIVPGMNASPHRLRFPFMVIAIEKQSARITGTARIFMTSQVSVNAGYVMNWENECEGFKFAHALKTQAASKPFSSQGVWFVRPRQSTLTPMPFEVLGRSCKVRPHPVWASLWWKEKLQKVFLSRLSPAQSPLVALIM